jgi:hypothetical protein
MDQLLTNISAARLRQAADLKERIESLQHDLARIFGMAFDRPRGTNAKNERKNAIQTIRASPSISPRRTMSPAVKARLSAIAKARWKKAKAAGKHAL